MTAQAKKIVADALRLPRAARAKLTEKLILSFDDSRTESKSETAWLAEIDRRRKEVTDGKNPLIPHEEVMRKAWSKLHAARRHAS
jgi:putative addiction module component (TIGR02574 family)